MSSRRSARTLSVRDIRSSRLLYRLVPSERRTGGTVYGLLPTVMTQGLKVSGRNGKTVFMPPEFLPTPTSIDGGSGRTNKSLSPNSKERPTIALAARMGLLPTPMASDADTGEIIGEHDRFVTNSAGTLRKINRNGTDGSVGLARMARLLPTPTAQDSRGNASVDRERLKLTDEIARIYSPGGGTSQLNPLYVGDMMGFPGDWVVSPFLGGGRSR